MSDSFLAQQTILLENRERILSELKKYPNVVSVGVGLKETNEEITFTLCYRVYVNEKKATDALQAHEKIPPIIDDFVTDVISYGVVEETANLTPIRPLVGGIQIKNEAYAVDNDKRGVGTLGCLAIPDDNEDDIVGLTCAHVALLNSESTVDASPNIGQPQKHICCCCCVKNLVGSVQSIGDGVDCATIKLHDDIVADIKAKGVINDIQDIGSIVGRVVATEGMLVKKSGAATGLTRGQVVDIYFDNAQVLIAPVSPYPKFADFGDSGSIVVDDNNRVIGLLWGTKRNRFASGEDPRSDSNQTDRLTPRVHGVVTPIEKVEKALGVKIPVPLIEVNATFSIQADDTKTYSIPAIEPDPLFQRFVTVKGEGDIILKVSFDQSIENDRISWASTFEEIVPMPGDNSTVKISRDVSDGSRSVISVKVDGYGVAQKAVLWIVWSKGTPVIPNLQVTIEKDAVNAITSLRAEFEIQPKSIFPTDTNKNVPDLRGANTTPPPNVPDTDSDEVFNKGADLSGGAKYKWDVSVSLRCKIINPKLVQGITGELNRPFTEYPSLPLVGNYDTSSLFAEDPYSPLIPEESGKLGMDWTMINELNHSAKPFDPPFDNMKLEFRIHYRFFARLELGGVWYSISNIDDVLGRTNLYYIRKDETMVGVDLNNDGKIQDYVWWGSTDDKVRSSVYNVNLCTTRHGNDDF